MKTDWKIGDTGYYVLPKGNGRPVDRYMPMVVVNVTAKRVVIDRGGPRPINTLPKFLAREAPAGAFVG